MAALGSSQLAARRTAEPARSGSALGGGLERVRQRARAGGGHPCAAPYQDAAAAPRVPPHSGRAAACSGRAQGCPPPASPALRPPASRAGQPYERDFFSRTSVSTTEGSASVETSPRESNS